MTKKDYIVIAQALKEATPTVAEHEQGTATDGWCKAVKCLCVVLQQQNPRFDRSKFLLACGVTE